MTAPGVPPGQLVCRRCQRAKPVEAFYRITGTDERVQPCIVCCNEPQPEPVDEGRARALTDRRAQLAEPVSQALAVCQPTEGEVATPAGFDLVETLLADALDILTDPDLHRFDRLPPRPQGGSQAGEPPPTPTHRPPGAGRRLPRPHPRQRPRNESHPEKRGRAAVSGLPGWSRRRGASADRASDR